MGRTGGSRHAICSLPTWLGGWLLLLAGAAQAVEIELARWPADEPVPAAEELVRGMHDARFEVQPPGSAYLIGDNTRPTWWRVRVREPWTGPEPPVFVAYAPYGNYLRILAPPSYRGTMQSIREPGLNPAHSRHAIVEPLSERLAPDTPVYVEIAQGRRLPPHAAIESRAAFEAGDIRYQRRMTALLTSIGVMFVVVAAFALALRDLQFVYLAGALGGQLLFLLLVTGEAYAMPVLRELAAYGVVPVWIARALGAASLLAFAVRFLDLGRHAPRLGRTLNWCALGFVALVLLSPAPNARVFVPPLGNALTFGSAFIAMIAGVIAWRRGSRSASFFLLAWVPVLLHDMLREGQLLGLIPLDWNNEYVQPATMAFAALLFSSGLAERMLAVRHERDAARREAERDPLTGVLNRSAIDARLRSACDEAWLTRNPLAILFLDLDRFKAINDSHGHAIGDACLAAVVARIARELRQGDSLGRYGGEEFLVVLPGASATDARAVAERIRADIAQSCRVVASQAVALTISIGVAEFAGGTQSPEMLVAAADAAMYEAKRQGRNRVMPAVA